MGSFGQNSTSLIRFGGEFELDLRAYELRRSGHPLKLEAGGQPFHGFLILFPQTEKSGAPSLRVLQGRDAMLPRQLREDGAPLALIVQRRSKAGPPPFGKAQADASKR